MLKIKLFICIGISLVISSCSVETKCDKEEALIEKVQLLTVMVKEGTKITREGTDHHLKSLYQKQSYSEYKIKDLQHLQLLQKNAQDIRTNTRTLSNFLVQTTSDMIKASGDPQFGKKDINAVPLDNHYEIERDADGNETYNFFSLSHLENKEDYETPAKLFVGVTHNPAGKYLLDSISNYKNKLCRMLTNYTDATSGITWSFSPPDYLWLDDESPEARITFSTNIKLEMSNTNPKDTAAINKIFSILSYPQVAVSNNGEHIPYIVKMFDRAPLIAAAAMFVSLRSDIISAENIAITLLSERAKIETLYKKNEDGTFEPVY